MITTKHRNKPDRFTLDELGGMEAKCHGGKGGGGSSTSYVQSPEARKLMKKLLPIMDTVYPGGKAATNLYDIPELKYNLPNQEIADVNDYIPQGDIYENVYNKIAPSLWSSYEQNVQNPLVTKFAKSGTLGAPTAGVGGAAMTVLNDSRQKAGNDISSQAYQMAQAPLTQAMQAENAMNQSKYAMQSSVAKAQAELPWQAQIQESQYPYQILPGMLGGTMPQPVTTTKSGGKK